MRQIICSAFVLTLLLSIAGCIDYSEQIVLDEDGSGTVSLSYKVASDFIPGFGKPESAKLKSENEDFAKRFEAEGVEITHTSVLDLNDSRAYSAEFTFNDNTALNALKFYKRDVEFVIKTGKTFKYTRTINLSNRSDKDIDKEYADKLAYMFRDNLFKFSVKMPAPVASSNGTISEDSYTVEWTYTLGDFVLTDKPIKMTAECNTSK